MLLQSVLIWLNWGGCFYDRRYNVQCGILTQLVCISARAHEAQQCQVDPQPYRRVLNVEIGEPVTNGAFRATATILSITIYLCTSVCDFECDHLDNAFESRTAMGRTQGDLLFGIYYSDKLIIRWDVDSFELVNVVRDLINRVTIWYNIINFLLCNYDI